MHRAHTRRRWVVHAGVTYVGLLTLTWATIAVVDGANPPFPSRRRTVAPTVSRPGIGTLTLNRANGLSVWSVDDGYVPQAGEPRATALFEHYSIPVDLILDDTEHLDRVDLPFVAEVLADVDHYLVAGMRFVHRRLLAGPAWFGLTTGGLDNHREFRPADFPLDLPRFVFYPGGEWLLYFQRGGFPICEPIGLHVWFDGRQPVRVADPRQSPDMPKKWIS